MAIHIRPRKSQVQAENRRRLRMRIAALLSALTLILVVGVTLYVIIINLPQQHSTSFISYTPVNEDIDDFSDRPEVREISASAPASASQSITPQIIVAAGASATSLPMADFSMDGDVFGSGMGLDLGVGIAPAGLGDGKGLGGTGSGKGDGPGSGSGRKHGKGSNDDIQVVILLDASGSMDQLFTSAAASLEQLLNMLNSCRLNGRPAKVNLGIVAYGQFKNNGAPWTVSKFSKDVKTMRTRLAEVPCDGSEEHCGEAIQYALKEFPWNMRERGQILKVIFIAGNEAFNQGPVDYHKALMQAREMGVIVNTIVCGGPDETWSKAAEEAGGEAFAINLEATDGATPAQRLDALKSLYECEAIATGSPADIEREEQEYRKRPALPNAKDIDKWLSKNQQVLLRGFEWDAVELCRRMGAEFTLEMVGGLPNLPDKLRAMSPEDALDYIRKAAQRRQDAIAAYKDTCTGGSEFCAAALEALRKQAAFKGIDIEL